MNSKIQRLMNGYIKLHRRLTEWEWYRNSEMVHLFIHLLLMANHKDNDWQGMKVYRGQVITGRKKLSENTGLSEQSIRTCIKRLKSTSEITVKTTNRYSVISICNYDKYNNIITDNNQDNNQPPNQQSTSDQPTTNHKQERKECKEGKEYKEDNIEFDVFWNLYNKKINRKGCERKWNKLKDTERQKIIDTLPSFLASIKDKQYQPYPETYLNQERWNDEVEKTKGHEFTDEDFETDLNGKPCD